MLPPLIRPSVHAYPTLDTAFWFLHLRWLAVFGQLLTLTVVYLGFGIQLAYLKIIALVAITAFTNLIYWWWLAWLQRRRGLQRTDRLPSDQTIAGLMLIDIADLTGLLYFTSGIANPFWLFYFVNVAMAAAILQPIRTWLLWACTVACVGLLLSYEPYPIEMLTSPMSNADYRSWTIPKFAYFISFLACSGVITYFITILTGELRQREHAIKDAAEAKARNRQLESLATLAGGAAHELATPLSTIAVVAKELGIGLEKQSAPDSTLRDIKLIRSELDRCRQILDRMTSATGQAAGERLQKIQITEFIQETLVGLREPDLVVVRYGTDERGSENLLPVQAAAQAVRNLIQNALDANPDQAHVHVFAKTSQDCWYIEVKDQGPGMSDEVIKRLGEPFFTTKDPGKGMGLGVYLAMNVIRRLDGVLEFDSQSDNGTTARITLPLTR